MLEPDSVLILNMLIEVKPLKKKSIGLVIIKVYRELQKLIRIIN